MQDTALKNEENSVIDPEYYYKQLTPVLRFDELRGLELADVYVSVASEPKRLSTIVAYLGTHFPLTKLAHLHRVRKTATPSLLIEVAIGQKSDVDAAPEEQLKHLKEEFGFELQVKQLPRHPPLMREQYKDWNEVWPLFYRVHIPSTPLDPSEYIPLDAIRSIEKHFRQLIPIAKEKGNACAILNSEFKLVASAEHTNTNALTHCAMNAIDMVAKLLSESSTETQFTHQKRSTEKEIDLSAKPADYLCTNGIALFVREPCIMCSMALLHSRIACVIYAVPNEKSGGLGSRFSIHCEPALNHHFYVYKGFLAADADTILSS